MFLQVEFRPLPNSSASHDCCHFAPPYISFEPLSKPSHTSVIDHFLRLTLVICYFVTPFAYLPLHPFHFYRLLVTHTHTILWFDTAETFVKALISNTLRIYWLILYLCKWKAVGGVSLDITCVKKAKWQFITEDDGVWTMCQRLFL